jgi:hypothetical protein
MGVSNELPITGARRRSILVNAVSSADAQSVYVAPGGVYVGSGPVYVIPAPNNGTAPYVAPTYGYEYRPPAVVAPAPAVVAPTTVYGPNGGYYAPPWWWRRQGLHHHYCRI